MSAFRLPDLGEGLEEAEIVAWHVAVGDQVVPDQPLVSVETDKAVVEVPSPRAGRIARLHGQPGDVVKTGAPLVEFEDAGRDDAGTVVGRISKEAERIDETAEPRRAPRGRAKAAPAVRALARQLGVDLAAVDASGPDGLVTADDVRRVAKVLAEAAPSVPLKGVRRAMAQKMSQAGDEAVPATVYDEADVEAWPPATDVTVRLIRAVAAGARAAPILNAWYDGAAISLRVMRKIDLGIAVDTPDGLFVPIMRDVGARDAADLRRGLDALKRDVEARAIPPEELRGATITLSNFGRFGAGRYAALVVVPPQVAIVGAGRIEPRVRAVGGRPAVCRTLPLSLTFDHRPINGAEAARFLAAMVEDLERP
jgi:pyruvate dehydrogenase E2 component (dihydrolipoamide acetyltransferase)